MRGAAILGHRIKSMTSVSNQKTLLNVVVICFEKGTDSSDCSSDLIFTSDFTSDFTSLDFPLDVPGGPRFMILCSGSGSGRA